VLLVVGSAIAVVSAGIGCGGGNGQSGGATSPSNAASTTVATDGSQANPEVDTWAEESSGPSATNGKASGVREYDLDVTRTIVPKAGYNGPTKTQPLRVMVRFPVPKVTPAAARDVHTVNRVLWDTRKEIAKCFYKGPGKDPGAEMSMVGWLDVKKSGEITGGGVESIDDGLKSTAGFDECVMANAKGLVFGPAGDDTKVRFKLKFQTVDASTLPDFKATPAPASS
jgi:hypothetical protein